MLELHKQYGPVVRIAPDTLAFFTGQSFLDIYQRTGSRAFKKNRIHYTPPPNGVDNLVTALDDQNHARQRKLWAPGFTGEALKMQEPLVSSTPACLHSGFGRSSGKPATDEGRRHSSVGTDLT